VVASLTFGVAERGEGEDVERRVYVLMKARGVRARFRLVLDRDQLKEVVMALMAQEPLAWPRGGSTESGPAGPSSKPPRVKKGSVRP
jgi:hypothetical protein